MDQPQQKNDSATQQSSTAATFALSRTDVVVIGLICIGIGVALGFFLPALGSLAATFPIPFGDVIEKLSRFDQAWVVIARPIIGGVLGLIAAFFIVSSTTPLAIDEHGITIGRDDDHPLHVSRASFSTAYDRRGLHLPRISLGRDLRAAAPKVGTAHIAPLREDFCAES